MVNALPVLDVVAGAVPACVPDTAASAGILKIPFSFFLFSYKSSIEHLLGSNLCIPFKEE